MGYFGTFVYASGQWTEHDLPPSELPDGPFLAITVHDSDLARVVHSGARGVGTFYLGVEPRIYFEDEEENEPVDAEAAAAALTAWAAETHVGMHIDAESIRRLIGWAAAEEPLDDFVEETVRRLLALLDIAPPDDLPANDFTEARQPVPEPPRS